MPCGSALQIEVNLQIETGDGKKVELNNVPLRFASGISSSKTDDGNEVEVEVTWYPEVNIILKTFFLSSLILLTNTNNLVVYWMIIIYY